MRVRTPLQCALYDMSDEFHSFLLERFPTDSKRGTSGVFYKEFGFSCSSSILGKYRQVVLICGGFFYYHSRFLLVTRLLSSADQEHVS